MSLLKSRLGIYLCLSCYTNIINKLSFRLIYGVRQKSNILKSIAVFAATAWNF